MMPENYKNWITRGFVLLSISMLVDFFLPGRQFQEQILDLNRQREEYFNAAQGYHYSYQIITAQHVIDLKESLFSDKLIESEVSYRVSWLFGEINQFQLADQEPTTYNLRIYSGLILPLLALVVLLLSFRYGERMGILLFVIQVALIADLIYLIQ